MNAAVSATGSAARPIVASSRALPHQAPTTSPTPSATNPTPKYWLSVTFAPAAFSATARTAVTSRTAATVYQPSGDRSARGDSLVGHCGAARTSAGESAAAREPAAAPESAAVGPTMT